MKKIYYSLIFIFFATLISCEKDTENVSRTTYYASFDITGNLVQFITLGTNYTEPGVKATEDGKELTVTTSISGVYSSFSGTAVDASKANKYLVSYSATNSDNFSATKSRVVYVAKTGDLVNSIEGLYTVDVVRGSKSYSGLKYILIWKTADNTYQISDAIGGYYDLGKAYGSTYMGTGATVVANNIAANNFTYKTTATVGTFGGIATVSNMVVNPTTKVITFDSEWDQGYTFNVTLTQVQF